MDKDYFNSLKNSVQDSERPTGNSSNILGKAFLTVKIDVDCKLYCDGDFLDLFEANKVKKIPIETGQHLITIESEHYDGVSEDHVVDAAEAGKNYLLLVNGMKQKEMAIFQQASKEEHENIEEKLWQERERQERERQEQEPYATLTNDNRILTFHFDNMKSSRQGMDIKGSPDLHFTWNDKKPREFEWRKYKNTITTVVFENSFSNCHSIDNTGSWFFELSKLTSIRGLNYLNTEKVVDMSYMFYGCESLEELDLSSFNTSNVQNMNSMFSKCNSLKKLILRYFNTENVTDMRYMFQECWSLQELNLRSFITRNVANMFRMFNGCCSLQNLDLSHFDTSSVTCMGYMFEGCRSLRELNLDGFDTRKVYDMRGMFGGCRSLQELDIRSFVNKCETNGPFGDMTRGMFEGVNDSIIRR
jgi:surface protein